MVFWLVNQSSPDLSDFPFRLSCLDGCLDLTGAFPEMLGVVLIWGPIARPELELGVVWCDGGSCCCVVLEKKGGLHEFFHQTTVDRPQPHDGTTPLAWPLARKPAVRMMIRVETFPPQAFEPGKILDMKGFLT